LKRRTAALGVAATGLAAGLGVAWWGTVAGTSDTGGASSAEGSSLWTRRFESPEGQPFAMDALRGRPLIVNFWATWCAPCVVELPLLDAFHRRHAAAGWQMLALAIDRADAVRRFVAEHGLTLPVAIAGSDGLELSRELGNTQGVLPFTALFDGGGRIRNQHVGVVDADLLARWKEEIDKAPKLSATSRDRSQTA